MNRNNQQNRVNDKRILSPGKNPGGSVELQSHRSGKHNELLSLGTKEVYTVPSTMSIIGSVEEMIRRGFRRLPVTDPGTQQLKGLVTAGDIIDFMGGGQKYNLVRGRHHGNLIAAVNEPVRKIMSTGITTLPASADLSDAVECILTSGYGGLPIVDKEMVLCGIFTERDALNVLSTFRSSLMVEEVMSVSPYVTSPDAKISDVTREMVKRKFRRLPVVSGEVLFGIITAMDVMRFLGDGDAFSGMETGNADEIMNLPIRELISGELYTTTPDMNIGETARMMISRGIGAFPVIEDARLVGIVTEFDMVRALNREM
jgi:CBS domain-containing protein